MKKCKSQLHGSPGACEHQQQRERIDSLALVKTEKVIAVQCDSHSVAIDVIILLRFKHVQLQVFLRTDLERPRPHSPHMGKDCGRDTEAEIQSKLHDSTNQ